MNGLNEKLYVESLLETSETPAWVLRYSLTISAYQRLLLLLKRFSLTGIMPESEQWRKAVTLLNDIYIPLGPFNFMEYALGDASRLEDLPAVLDSRALYLSQSLSDAIMLVQDSYQRKMWQEHALILEDAMLELTHVVGDKKDELVNRLASWLAVPVADKPFIIYLVPQCHEEGGAYSHPTVVDVSRHREVGLVEVVLHEFAHVLLDQSRHEEKTLWKAVHDSCREKGRTTRYALEIMHLMVFHATAETTQKVYGTDYIPYITKKGIYKRVAQKLGTNLKEEDMRQVLNENPMNNKSGLEDFASEVLRAFE